MRRNPAIRIIALSLALFIPAAAVAQDILGDNILLTDGQPDIFFDDTSTGGDGNEWSIAGWDQNFRVFSLDAATQVLRLDPNNLNASFGFGAVSSGANSLALGFEASSVGLSGTALGRSASAGGISSIALGYGASSEDDNGIALGYFASSVANGGIALGALTDSTGVSSTALGYGASSSGLRSTALGYNASATGDDSAALGEWAAVSGHFGTAVGYQAYTFDDRSTALGYRALANQPDTVIIGAIANVNGAAAYANVGMGTSAPLQAVDVERSGAAARFQLTSFTNVLEEAPQYIQRRARGTRTLPSALLSGDNIGLFSFRGHNGSGMGGSRATITAQAAGNFTSVSTPTRLIFATTPVGQTTPQQVLVITPDGKVQVNGQNLSVPDYVFEDDYELMPLEELRAFIDENGHLPGIPSADQVNSEGLDLAGSQMGLLQKVEELTLYTLQLQAQAARQQEQINELKALVGQLVPQVARN